MVRKIVGHDIGHIYAMKVLKKATLKGMYFYFIIFQSKFNLSDKIFLKH